MAVGACYPAGFAAGVAACGMKRSGKADLTLLASDRPATAAGVFTTNRVVAAPVTVSRAQIQGGLARAIVTNSGSANACTGTARPPQRLDDGGRGAAPRWASRPRRCWSPRPA